MIIRTQLHGEKSHSYRVTIKTGGAPAPQAPLFPMPMFVCMQATCVYRCMQICYMIEIPIKLNSHTK